MASVAYAYNRKFNGSGLTEAKPSFRLIEGGHAHSSDKRTYDDQVEVVAALPLPTEQEVSALRPHPKYAGLATVLVAIAVSLAICVVSVISSHVISSRISASVESVPATDYRVCAGDSLWSIAETHPIQGHSASEVVTWIMERNNLNNGLIVAGQSLYVPSQML